MTPLSHVLSAAPASSLTPGQWAVVSLGIFTIVYIAVIRPMKKGKRRDPLEYKPQRESVSQQRSVEREMSNLLVEYEQMIRQMTAQLDTRAARLELLIKDAESKIAQLKVAANSVDAPPPRDIVNMSAGQDQAVAASDAAEEPAADDRSMRDIGIADAKDVARSDESSDDSHVAVYRLADSGRSPRQIAHELDRPSGEVELILALRGSRL